MTVARELYGMEANEVMGMPARVPSRAAAAVPVNA